ncbi:putative glycerol-1-phosphate prenyltransferase [Pelagirhabdus alkalitolerans]|uniref:Heptaprenylglyceryl phosphate synthase n=1 Tax=Pelagirhabdus alkalitolerans TaxID=1612202 RepID=A0A1G6IS85_9BACI|nr:heptaprenylglyceryl phosphate synthase [Pelagirhabdus alkalitolerans]SDC09432.1 putative glycerol-1-phosphate prenyltransferase [Pelagirhabdus alkalitolerans]
MYETWQHVFKLDPNKTLTFKQLDAVCQSNTDAIIIGGTDGVTLEDTLELMTYVRKYNKPCLLEVSTMEALMPGFDYYGVPMVLNSQEKKWMMDLQHEAVKDSIDLLDRDRILAEGYVIMNPKAKAYQLTNCFLPTNDDVVAYAEMAETLFRLPFFYLEYSGTYGDVDLLKKVSERLDHTQLIYGGGIKSIDQAREMAQYADTIVVGNSLYDHFDEALKTANITKE